MLVAAAFLKHIVYLISSAAKGKENIPTESQNGDGESQTLFQVSNMDLSNTQSLPIHMQATASGRD